MDFIVTPSAIDRIAYLLKSEKEGTFFRIRVMGGGCSGFQYNFLFDEVLTNDDKIFENKNKEAFAKVVIDETSFSLLKGSTLDFYEDLTSSKFQVNNPNAQMGCGCGKSFSL